jgi:hypothetical protein
MSDPIIIRPGHRLYPTIERINRRLEDALRAHRGKPGVEAAIARAEARAREVERMLAREEADRGNAA